MTEIEVLLQDLRIRHQYTGTHKRSPAIAPGKDRPETTVSPLVAREVDCTVVAGGSNGGATGCGGPSGDGGSGGCGEGGGDEGSGRTEGGGDTGDGCGGVGSIHADHRAGSNLDGLKHRLLAFLAFIQRSLSSSYSSRRGCGIGSALAW